MGVKFYHLTQLSKWSRPRLGEHCNNWALPPPLSYDENNKGDKGASSSSSSDSAFHGVCTTAGAEVIIIRQGCCTIFSLPLNVGYRVTEHLVDLTFLL